MLEDLKEELLEYEIAEKFLADMRKGFRGEDEREAKVVELKKLEQRSKTIKEFVQKFRRAARGSGYKERLLIEEFKREINNTVYQKLIEAE